MSVDLKGNTNFVVLKNLQDELIVPRTNLAAVDMAVANGLSVAGSTLSITMATTEDIELGTTGSVVTPDALKPILDSKQPALEAGTGVELVAGETASTISVPLTDVETLIDGTTATKVVDVAALRGALTTGQAVDVTSAPDGVTGDYLGSFTVTGSSLGFAAFPKYAKNLNYLFIATIVPTTAGTVTPSANCKWLDTGDRAAKSVAAGVSVKLAVTFTSSANTCPASFALSGTGSVTVSYCRQYEVTACTAESIAYIASLSNPDAFADYYLVKADMVQPWTYIIDMGTSPAVTVAAGLSYKLNASTGTHTLTVDTCPEGYDGRDAIIRITLGGSGIVQAVAPLQLGGALVPYAINNCVVRFRDGEAVLLVEDTLAGYVVTVTSGTDSGSLAYGLASTGIPYIAFSTSTDGQVVDMGNAVTANEEVTVVGNGYTDTTITGNITCTNKTTVANLGLQDVTVVNGALTLGDAYIPSGSTVAVSGGALAVEKVTGNGGVIDLGGERVNVYRQSATIQNVTLTNGKYDASPAAIYVQSSGSLVCNNATFTDNIGSGTGIVGTYKDAWSVVMSGCSIYGNKAKFGGGINVNGSGTMNLVDCFVKGNTATNPLGNNTGDIFIETNATVILDGGTIGNVCLNAVSNTQLKGHVLVNSIYPRSDGVAASVTLTSGATLDLTGNSNPTPIAPGGAITFASGGATVAYTSGTGSKTYMLDNVTLPAGAKLTNAAAVNLSGTNVAVSRGATANGSGLTFIGGSANGGGAFSIGSSATATFNNCIFSGNSGTSNGAGGALYVLSGTLDMSGCVVSGNRALNGAGLFMYSGSCNLVDCIISGNTIGTAVDDAVLRFGANVSVVGGTYGTVGLRDGSMISLKGNVKVTNIQAREGGSGSVTIGSGATINITSSINPGGAITFASGGATVLYSSGAVSGSYSMDNVNLPAGAKLTNTATVGLGGTNVLNSGNANASGVVFSGGSASLGGAVYNYEGATANYTSCTFANNRANNGAGVSVNNSATVATFIDCTISGNTASTFGGGMYCNASATTNLTGCRVTANKGGYGGGLFVSAGAKVELASCDVSGNTTNDIYIGSGGSVTLKDSNTIGLVTGVSGTVTLTSGAILDLTGNTNAAPIAPGGGITLDASPSSGVVIIGSAGSGTQTRTFVGGGTITGSAVTKIGAISGATVTLPSSSCQIEFVKSGETVVSSAFIQASETPYVLETQQGTGAVLVRTTED